MAPSACPVCAAPVSDQAKFCPICGSQLADQQAAAPAPPTAPLQFPPRRGLSITDDLRRQHQQAFLLGGQHAQPAMYIAWGDLIENRPFDVPLYTAVNGRATICILFAASSIPDHHVIGSVVTSRSPMALQLRAFIDGPYPVVRANFLFPDNPRSPFFLESPLDVANGDFQDFCLAVLDDDRVDIVIQHELAGDLTYGVTCRAPRLAPLLQAEVAKAIAALRPPGTRDQFQASVDLMTRAFPSAADGISREWLAPFQIIGGLDHQVIVVE